MTALQRWHTFVTKYCFAMALCKMAMNRIHFVRQFQNESATAIIDGIHLWFCSSAHWSSLHCPLLCHARFGYKSAQKRQKTIPIPYRSLLTEFGAFQPCQTQMVSLPFNSVAVRGDTQPSIVWETQFERLCNASNFWTSVAFIALSMVLCQFCHLSHSMANCNVCVCMRKCMNLCVYRECNGWIPCFCCAVYGSSLACVFCHQRPQPISFTIGWHTWVGSIWHSWKDFVEGCSEKS